MKDNNKPRPNIHPFKLLYSKIAAFNSKCKVQNLIYYFKVTTFRAFLEALVTFYVVVAWILFSPIFLSTRPYEKKPLIVGDPELFAMIVLPIIVGFVTCVVYMGIFIVFTLIGLNCGLKTLPSKGETITSASYKKFQRHLMPCIYLMHLLGIMSYGAVAFFTASFIQLILKPSLFVDYNGFVIQITQIGLIAGAIWNIQDLLGDMRVDWGFISKRLGNIAGEEKNTIYSGKFITFIIHSLVSLVVVVCIIITVAILVWQIRGKPENAARLFQGEFLQSVYVVLFFTVLVLYSTTLFTSYYTSKSEDQRVFPKIDEFIDNMNTTKDEHIFVSASMSRRYRHSARNEGSVPLRAKRSRYQASLSGKNDQH